MPQASPEAATGPAATGPAAPGPAASDTAPDPRLAARPDPAAPPPEVDANPERFLGRRRPRSAPNWAGPPWCARRARPGVWQYRGRACVLDLVLYPGTDGPTVRHLEARDPVDAKPHDTAACLKTLLRRRAVAATG
ncbi:MAG: hypothetical protein U5L06_15305 [Rhodovibrio sp.]|nr:hypothetical protein [Rhodovibrio sp.]